MNTPAERIRSQLEERIRSRLTPLIGTPMHRGYLDIIKDILISEGLREEDFYLEVVGNNIFIHPSTREE